MKIAVTSARVLLGFLFHIFGLNGFLHFIPMKPPAGLAGQYLALYLSHYLTAHKEPLPFRVVLGA